MACNHSNNNKTLFVFIKKKSFSMQEDEANNSTMALYDYLCCRTYNAILN